MTDRELLKAAARAAGYKALEWHKEIPREGGISVDVLYVGHFEAHRPFKPLEDDGDALRLAVRLGIETQFAAGATWFQILTNDECSVGLAHEPHNGDPYAATRRAIVRAAAAMGGSDE